MPNFTPFILAFCFFVIGVLFMFIWSFIPEKTTNESDKTENSEEITGQAFVVPLSLFCCCFLLFVIELAKDSKIDFLISIKSLLSVIETPIMILLGFLFIYCLALGIKLFKQIETRELAYPSLLSVGILLISSISIYFLVFLIIVPFYVCFCKKKIKLQQIINNQKS